MLYELLSGDTLRGVRRTQLQALRDAYDISVSEHTEVSVIRLQWGGTSKVVCTIANGVAYVLRPAMTLN